MKEVSKEERQFIRERLNKTLRISAKRKENKQKLIGDILDMFKENMYSYESCVLDLCKESLQKRTQKQLKEWL